MASPVLGEILALPSQRCGVALTEGDSAWPALGSCLRNAGHYYLFSALIVDQTALQGCLELK